MREFSALLSSVRKSERTDQFEVLAALYHLGAVDRPTTAVEVKALLKMHLGSQAPRNVPMILRRSSALIEVASSGRPLTWRLTEKGVAKLSEITGLELSLDVAEFQSDVCFLCALAFPEFSALVNALGGEANWVPAGSPNLSHVYHETTLQTTSGSELRVVATTCTSMGLTAAAIATTQMIMTFRPRLVVMVGIAAGTHDGGKQFGDVLVADPSIDYNSGKVVFEHGLRGFQPDPYPIGLNARLRSVLNRYRQHSVFDEIRKRWPVPLAFRNRLHIGPLGAADQVIDDPTRILEIQRNWRKLIGIEMETYGVYRACHEAPDPKPRVLSLKAVCDFAANKTDSFQDYAAFVAAEFAIAFLTREWDTLWPTTKD